MIPPTQPIPQVVIQTLKAKQISGDKTLCYKNCPDECFYTFCQNEVLFLLPRSKDKGYGYLKNRKGLFKSKRIVQSGLKFQFRDFENWLNKHMVALSARP